jgi:hypothetical protein
LNPAHAKRAEQSNTHRIIAADPDSALSVLVTGKEGAARRADRLWQKHTPPRHQQKYLAVMPLPRLLQSAACAIPRGTTPE